MDNYKTVSDAYDMMNEASPLEESIIIEKIDDVEEKDLIDVEITNVDDETKSEKCGKKDKVKEEESEEDTIDESKTIIIDEKTYGISQGMLNAFRKGADLVVKKVCPKCGFHMPQFTGRYPKECPLCGTVFDPEQQTPEKIGEKYGVYEDGQCIGIVHDILDEGKFKDLDTEIKEFVNTIIKQVKSNKISNKKELNKALQDITKDIESNKLKNIFPLIVKEIGNILKKEGIKL